MFLHPFALLALAGAAIPALLHLFQRATPPEADFPPLRYLTEAERRSARQMRLRHLLLLVLRTLLIVSVVLAAARPLVSTRTGSTGGHPPTALALILDNSLSSGAMAGGQLTLDRLKAAARSVLRRATRDDRLWLLLADGVARAGGRDDLLAAVDSATAEPLRLDLVAAVNRMGRIVAAEPTAAHEVQVVSDLQRSALEDGRVSVPGVGIAALVSRRAPENRGIAAARVTSGIVAVTLAGTPGAGATPVTLRFGGREVARALAAPGTTVTLPFPDPGPGWWVGELVLEPDELRGDDRRDVAWHTAPPASVRAAPPSGPFVAAALAAMRAGRLVVDGAEVTIDERPGRAASIVLPPADPALLGEVNRAVAQRGVRWRFGAAGTPGSLAEGLVAGLDGVAVRRRLRLEGGDAGSVLARVNGEPWAVASEGTVLVGSRMDTAWTALPVAPAFVPFLDALVNRFARGEEPVEERVGASRVTFRTVGTDTVGAIVFAPDPRESDLTPADLSLIRTAIGADVRDDAQFAARAFAGAGRTDATGLLLFVALVIALVELGVATIFR